MDGVRRTTTFGVKAPIFCRIARLFVSLGLLLLLAAANPFGLRTASDEESEDIVFRLIAPLYGGTEARDAITVLLVTDRDLELWGKEWPLQHTEQGDILYALHKVAPGPRALFYDFLFTDKREGSEYFSFALNSFEKSAPVLLSAMTTETPRTLGEHHGVLPALARNAELVAVQWAGHGRAYPLWVQAADGRWQMTPAMRLYQIYCAEQPDSCPADDFFHMPSADTDVPPALSLVWGGRPSRWQMDELPSRLHIIQETPCMEFGEGWQLVDSYVRLIYHGLAGNTAPIQPCFYHDTIPWRLAFDRNLGFVSPDIEEKISDRLVLMGGRLDAIQDEWPTPVHGKVPGVLHHAMALDNLITMGAAYLRYPPNIVSNMSLDDLIEIFLLLVILTKASQVRAVRETGTCWSIQALSSRKQPVVPARIRTLLAIAMAASVAGLVWCTSRPDGGPEPWSGAFLLIVGVIYALVPPNMDALAARLARPRLKAYPRLRVLTDASLITVHIVGWLILLGAGVALPVLFFHKEMATSLQWYPVLFLGLGFLVLLLPVFFDKHTPTVLPDNQRDWLVPAILVQGVAFSALVVAVTSMAWRLLPINWLAIIAISFVVLPVADLFRNLFDRLCMNRDSTAGD